MTERGEFSSHTAAVDLIGKKLLQEIAHINTARTQQQAFASCQEFRELADVGGVSADGERSQSLLDSQIVEKAGKHARIGFWGHEDGINRVCALSDADKSAQTDALILCPHQPLAKSLRAARNPHFCYLS